ncbi:hypothetical protein [Microvirga sp. CF3016]|uniref:hypothetical protein n=1 Tax=Microvirga sp. CF3016 TaxID=3110181 RepID=UPI002E78618E|nr:hypothetical protein [Microvirga sp. CF3016]MEE1612609.1 hypothetical protein [Microvirga sp. CF3016]
MIAVGPLSIPDPGQSLDVMEGSPAALNFQREIKIEFTHVVNFIAGNGDLLFLNVMIEVEAIGEALWIIVPGLQRSPNDPSRTSTKIPKDLTR